MSGETDGEAKPERYGCTIISALNRTERVQCNNCGETSIKGRRELFDCPFCPGRA